MAEAVPLGLVLVGPTPLGLDLVGSTTFGLGWLSSVWEKKKKKKNSESKNLESLEEGGGVKTEEVRKMIAIEFSCLNKRR